MKKVIIVFAILAFTLATMVDAVKDRMLKLLYKNSIDELVEEKHRLKGGMIPNSSYCPHVEALNGVGQKTSLDSLYKAVSRAYDKKYSDGGLSSVMLSHVHTSSGDSIVLGLTSPESSATSGATNEFSAAADATSGATNDSSDADDNAPATTKRHSRPPGTTEENKSERAKRKKKCEAAITHEYATSLTAARLAQPGKKTKFLPTGFLSNLIEAKKAEFQVKDEIKARTIKSRMRRENHDPKSAGV